MLYASLCVCIINIFLFKSGPWRFVESLARHYTGSPTVQDMFRSIPDLIHFTGVTLKLLSYAKEVLKMVRWLAIYTQWDSIKAVRATNCPFVEMWLYMVTSHSHLRSGIVICTISTEFVAQFFFLLLHPHTHTPTHPHLYHRSDYISETVHSNTAAAASKGIIAVSFPYYVCPSSIPS